MKKVFTSKRVKITIVLIFVVVIGNMLPVYYVSRLTMKFSPVRNKTLLGLVFTDDREIIEAVTLATGSVFIPLSAFVIVVVCTALLVVKLRDKTKWRQMSTTPGQYENASLRDLKVTKMVVVISTLFISCFVPVCLMMIAMILVPELSIEGKYRNLFICIFSVCFVLESTNSAMNIFIYYHMSSRYRDTFLAIFIKKINM